jgi:hypothetical protein
MFATLMTLPIKARSAAMNLPNSSGDWVRMSKPAPVRLALSSAVFSAAMISRFRLLMIGFAVPARATVPNQVPAS